MVIFTSYYKIASEITVRFKVSGNGSVVNIFTFYFFWVTLVEYKSHLAYHASAGS